MDLITAQEWKAKQYGAIHPPGPELRLTIDAIASMLTGHSSPSDTAKAITKAYKSYVEAGLRFAVQANSLLCDGIESDHKDEYIVTAQAWKVLLPVSAAWITIAGERLYKICLGDDNAGQNHFVNRVWDRQKWDVWKEQLRSFENRADFDEECRSTAAQARNKMERVELEYAGQH